MTEQEKLDILVSNYKKLEENRKDYIRELIRKLLDIHSGEEYRNTAFQNSRTAVSGINCIKGVFA